MAATSNTGEASILEAIVAANESGNMSGIGIEIPEVITVREEEEIHGEYGYGHYFFEGFEDDDNQEEDEDDHDQDVVIYDFDDDEGPIEAFINSIDHPSRPLTSSEIERVQIHVIAVIDIEKELECSICFEQFTLGENVRKLPCTHIYHHSCLSTWLQQKGDCPFCRSPARLSLDTSPVSTDTTNTLETVSTNSSQIFSNNDDTQPMEVVEASIENV